MQNNDTTTTTTSGAASVAGKVLTEEQNKQFNEEAKRYHQAKPTDTNKKQEIKSEAENQLEEFKKSDQQQQPKSKL